MPPFKSFMSSSSKSKQNSTTTTSSTTTTTKPQARIEPSGRPENSSSAIRYHPFFREFGKLQQKQNQNQPTKKGSKKRPKSQNETAIADDDDEEDEDEELTGYSSDSTDEGYDRDYDSGDSDSENERFERFLDEGMSSANSSILPNGSTVVQPNLLPIPRFFGGGKDPLGRTLDQILGWSDERLEMQHNYIQVVFPLPEHSYFAGPDIPLLDESSIAVFLASTQHRSKVFKAFRRMMSFYGFDVIVKTTNEGLPMADPKRTIEVVPSDDFEEKVIAWIGGHNNLRITRILRSLRLLGLQTEAEAFHKALMEIIEMGKEPTTDPRLRRKVQQPFVQSGILYWTRAAKRPLYIPPDVNEHQAQKMIAKREEKRARIAALAAMSETNKEENAKDEQGENTKDQQEEKGKKKEEEKVAEDAGEKEDTTMKL